MRLRRQSFCAFLKYPLPFSRCIPNVFPETVDIIHLVLCEAAKVVTNSGFANSYSWFGRQSGIPLQANEGRVYRLACGSARRTSVAGLSSRNPSWTTWQKVAHSFRRIEATNVRKDRASEIGFGQIGAG